MKRPLTILKDVRKLFSDSTKWTQGWFARTASGHRVGAVAKNATCFCLVGGLRRVALSQEDLTDTANLYKAMDEIRETIGNTNLVGWNDSPYRTARQVRAALDKTIKRMETK